MQKMGDLAARVADMAERAKQKAKREPSGPEASSHSDPPWFSMIDLAAANAAGWRVWKSQALRPRANWKRWRWRG